MLPEEKIARRFSEKRQLKPPVDVDGLLREFADLEEDFLPADYDAVFLDRSEKHPRPRVIVRINQPDTRRVFTLAHELGHIIIPWHNGTHFCRVDGNARLIDDIVASVEAQANRFAAELLMPSGWVDDLINSVKGLGDLVEAVKRANVSYLAASIRLAQLLPTGYSFVEVDSGSKVIRSMSSEGTWVLEPSMASNFREAEFNSAAEERVTFKSGSSRILWRRLHRIIKPPRINQSNETASDLLRRISHEVFSNETTAKNAVMRVNGIIGAANGANIRSHKSDLFTILKQRFLGREDLDPLITHAEFDEFLYKRVIEIEQNRGIKR